MYRCRALAARRSGSIQLTIAQVLGRPLATASIYVVSSLWGSGKSIGKGWDLAQVPEAKFQDNGGTSRIVAVMHGRWLCVRSLEIVSAEVWEDHNSKRSWCDHSGNSFQVLGPSRHVDQR